MNKTGKIITVVLLIALVGVVIAVKNRQETNDSDTAAPTDPNSQTVTHAKPQNPENQSSIITAENSENLPHLIDLGADKCIPCKAMKPILDDLQQNYKEQFKVTFIDVWKNQQQARAYNIMTIPTQIFFDANGKELFRHQGFYSKQEILDKWQQLGLDIKGQR